MIQQYYTISVFVKIYFKVYNNIYTKRFSMFHITKTRFMLCIIRTPYFRKQDIPVNQIKEYVKEINIFFFVCQHKEINIYASKIVSFCRF